MQNAIAIWLGVGVPHFVGWFCSVILVSIGVSDLESWVINSLSFMVLLNFIIGLRSLYLNFFNNRILVSLYDHYFEMMGKVGDTMAVILQTSEAEAHNETSTSWEEWDGSSEPHA